MAKGPKPKKGGQVVTRFAPSPTGFLHIGHVKAALLNDYYCRKYGGKLILRFDDTNPSKERGDYVDAITEDLGSIGIVPDVITHTSDYFDLFLDKCQELLVSGDAFVDDTPVQLMREVRGNREPSSRRSNSVEENLALWEEMKKGSTRGLECCVRVKIDYANQNGTLRDPVIYRCNLDEHNKTGSRYKVYPTYDFACPILDAHEGVTHALRANEYRERNAQYQWFLDHFNLRKVHIHDFGRLNFEYSVMSKRLLTQFVDKKIVDGWNDPRFPTVQGILRRGLTLQALRDFILLQGSSDCLITMEWDKIWAMNKSVLEPQAARYNAVVDPVVVKLEGEGVPSVTEWRSVPLLQKNPEAGDKMVPYASEVLLAREDVVLMNVEDKVTLMGWGNAFVTNIEKDSEDVIKSVSMKLALDDRVFKGTLKVQWIAHVPDVVSFDISYYGYLVTTRKVDPDTPFEELANRNSKKVVQMVGEPALKSVAKGSHLQLQRLGFFIVDQAFLVRSGLQLIYVPSGRGTLTIEDLFPTQ
ncbi:hypothetical protein GEMRC1_003430 [Eukaryota sp. GEM-RC1]